MIILNVNNKYTIYYILSVELLPFMVIVLIYSIGGLKIFFFNNGTTILTKGSKYSLCLPKKRVVTVCFIKPY